jgi:hypothetical protein
MPTPEPDPPSTPHTCITPPSMACCACMELYAPPDDSIPDPPVTGPEEPFGPPWWDLPVDPAE